MDKLQNLLAKGPPPNRGLRGLVLGRYHEIAHARRQLWQWGEIAEALDLPPISGPSLGEAFRRVEKKVKAGTLEPPTTGPAPRQAGQGTATPSISARAAKSESATTAGEQRPARPGFTNIPIDK
jgi:hypothetical protein